MRMNAEVFYTPLPQDGTSNASNRPGLLLVKTTNPHGKHEISPIIWGESEPLPLAGRGDGLSGKGIAIVNPPDKWKEHEVLSHEPERVGEVIYRHRAFADKIPVVAQVKHTAEVVFMGERARTDLLVDVARENISEGRVKEDEIVSFIKNLEQGDARWIIGDSVMGTFFEGAVLSLNTSVGITSVVLSDDKLWGAVLGALYGVAIQGIIRNIYYLPRTAIEALAYFRGKDRTKEEGFRFGKIHGAMFALTFTPLVGVVMPAFISYLRNEEILKHKLSKLKDRIPFIRSSKKGIVQKESCA